MREDSALKAHCTLSIDCFMHISSRAIPYSLITTVALASLRGYWQVTFYFSLIHRFHYRLALDINITALNSTITARSSSTSSSSGRSRCSDCAVDIKWDLLAETVVQAKSAMRLRSDTAYCTAKRVTASATVVIRDYTQTAQINSKVYLYILSAAHATARLLKHVTCFACAVMVASVSSAALPVVTVSAASSSSPSARCIDVIN
jgi:hypothetical protein